MSPRRRIRKVRIEPVPGTALAESKDEAKRVRQDIILPALSEGSVVLLDFADVEFATQSFIHALISDAIRRYGSQAFDLLEFANCSDEVRQIVLTVFEYTLDAADAAKGIPD